MLSTSNHVLTVPATAQLGLVTPVATFSNPIITSLHSSPDPWLVYHEGFYYFCYSDKTGIWVWKSPTITGLDAAVKVRVWTAPTGTMHSKELWAPELHFIDGKWYIYYAADDGKNINHRMYVLESTTADPQGDYFDRGKITCPADKWAIDGTVLEKEGKLYFIWSGWPGNLDGLQNLYIAPMSNPWTISGERVLLSTPTYAWEGWINEGPQVLWHGDELFVVYSANASWTADYCLGLLSFEGGDILQAANWSKCPRPVFQKTVTLHGAVYSVGHCSFTKSPDGTEDWIIYHGKESARNGWIGRTARAQKFGWDAVEAMPLFGHPIPAGVQIEVPSGEENYQEPLELSA